MQHSVTTGQLETSQRLETDEPVPALVVPPAPLAAWLTLEKAAYLALALLALGLRLINLGAHPLSDAEAGQALVAWRIYQGLPVEQAGYSPLVATLNLAAFFLLGATDFAARLGPALLGIALVLLPYGLRRHLGRGGALAASALLAVSPSAVYLSRTVNGDIGAAVGGLALTAGLFNWLDSLRDSEGPDAPSPVSSLYMAAAGLVLLLTASPASYTLLVLLVGFLGLAAVVGDKSYATSAREALTALRTRLMGWGNFGLALLIGFLVVATAFLLNMRGLAASADLLTGWLLSFAPATAMPGAYPAVFLLTLYEPLILLAGLFGLSASLLRRRLIDLFLVWWFFGAVGVNLLRSGHTNSSAIIPLVPLALLAGLAIGMLWDSLRREGSWQKEGMLVGIGVVIGGYALISLLAYSLAGGPAIWLPVAGVALFAGLAVLFAVWYDTGSALRSAALTALLALSVFTLATGSRLNYTFVGVGGGGEPVADPRQPLVRTPAGEGLADLAATLERVSSWETGDPYLLNIIADDGLGAAVEWRLRYFQNVTWVDNLAARISGERGVAPDSPLQAGEFEALLTPGDAALSSEDGYVGQDFAVRAAWSPSGLGGQALIRWIFLREAPTPIEYQRAVLWLEAPEQAPAAQEQDMTPGVSAR